MDLTNLIPGAAQAKMIFAGIIVVAVLGTAGTLYYKWNAMKADIVSLTNKNIAFDLRDKEQDKTIDQMKTDIILKDGINKDLIDQRTSLQKDLNSLEAKFHKLDRDFGKLALSKPAAIERVINKGTINTLRCFELLSGQPLTEEEKNGKINPACTDLVPARTSK